MSKIDIDMKSLSPDMSKCMVRPRINALLGQAANSPLTIVCAGMGYGKTRAVSDFAELTEMPVIWVSVTDDDNAPSYFWEDLLQAVSKINKPFADELRRLGFPDTDDKLSRYFFLRQYHMPDKHMLVLDDFHLLKDPIVIHFVERNIYNTQSNHAVIILISRAQPQVNVLNMQIRGFVQNLSEDDLNFTEDELKQFLRQQRVSAEPQIIREILRDTNGWPFSVSLAAQSLRKTSVYSGYVSGALAQNISSLINTEVWGVISGPLKHLLTQLSLIKHFSAGLVNILNGGDETLMAELGRQNAFIRLDGFAGAYIIHPALLNFLRSKQRMLTQEEKFKTYRKTAEWCKQNGYMADAFAYYEKSGDYNLIAASFFNSFTFAPPDIAICLAGIFERAPADVYNNVDLFAALRLFTLMGLGRWREAYELCGCYEGRFIAKPEGDVIRNHTLNAVYCCLGMIRALMCTFDDQYDFDMYFKKMGEYPPGMDVKINFALSFPYGMWINNAGASRQGSPREYIGSLSRAVTYLSSSPNDITAGSDSLCMGEFLFYQGDIRGAEGHIAVAMEHFRLNRRFDLIYRALFYTMRIAVLQGNRSKAKQAMEGMKNLLNEESCPSRFIIYDIASGWYCYILCQPKSFPEWLRDNFVPYGHANSIENFGNQAKARYHYLTKGYHELLAYIEAMKCRESVLYGRIEMLSIEACAYYKMKDRDRAVAVLREAYEAASPNSIIMPFIELGKDMRTLTAFAMSDPNRGIPREWLKNINQKASYYARYQALFISNYKRENGETISLSGRESEIIGDIYNGLTRSEIAVKYGLSVNTVKLITNNIYKKLNANSIVELIRIAGERKLV